MDDKERDFREQIEKIRYYASEQFDKQIVYISSGALVLSIGFIKEIVDVQEAKCIILIIFSWSFFAMALIFNLVSHRTSIIALDSNLEQDSNKEKTWNNLTVTLNNLSLLILILGIVLFVLFISLNLNL